MNETDLIQALQQKDRNAFTHLVETYQHLVYNTALGVVQSVEDAEDLAQEVFIQVFQSIGTFNQKSKLSTWIYRITITKSLDFVRYKKRKKRFAFITELFSKDEERKEEAVFIHPGVIAENRERSAILFENINKLPENQRIAFLLLRVEQLSYKEIADIMETTVKAVESLTQRANGNLRKLLGDYYKS